MPLIVEGLGIPHISIPLLLRRIRSLDRPSPPESNSRRLLTFQHSRIGCWDRISLIGIGGGTQTHRRGMPHARFSEQIAKCKKCSAK
jgi:hypothetical protein